MSGKTININIDTLVKEIVVGRSTKANRERLRKEVGKTLLDAVRDADPFSGQALQRKFKFKFVINAREENSFRQQLRKYPSIRFEGRQVLDEYFYVVTFPSVLHAFEFYHNHFGYIKNVYSA